MLQHGEANKRAVILITALLKMKAESKYKNVFRELMDYSQPDGG